MEDSFLHLHTSKQFNTIKVFHGSFPTYTVLSKLQLVSFFAGGGLLDLGFEQAGFKIAWANEREDVFADMYEFAIANWRKANGKRGGVKVAARQPIESLTGKQVLKSAFPHGRPKCFGVIGCPPCPDFSTGGLHMGSKGENGKLTKNFVDQILDIRPQFFLMENVAGLVRFKKHRSFLTRQLNRLRQKGRYLVDFKILNSLELGLPQSRERVFVVGCRKYLAENALSEKLDWSASEWFPWPHDPIYANAKNLPWPTTSPFGKKPRKPKRIPDELTVNSLFSKANDPTILPNGDEFFLPKSKKFQTRAEGDVKGKSFKRLHRFRYSPTAWYGNQEVHLHPWEARRISVREALRIQTAPDTYVLPADFSLSAKFRIIGNGVPCEMARLVAVQLNKLISAGAS